MTPLPILEVTDREGNVLESHRPDPHEVIKADTAFIMTSLFQGVIERGTAQWASTQIHDWPIAGKTGTTDDATDAWFIGFDPDITIGVWVGYDQKKTMGKEVQGAAVALPVWIDIMKPWIERRRTELGAPPVFAQPGNIVFQVTPEGILEAYIAGTEPGGRHN
jgi:penicillin-binding protein 1A